MARLLTPRLTKYIRHKPWPKQLAFLWLPHKEAIFGGAAGGGKSFALLAGALQFVDIPGYHALILRRTYRQLEKADSIMALSKEWILGTDARWNEQKHVWAFPSGASLAFGHMETETAKYDYQGAAYQYIAFDELTQFTETMYTYLFSRLRRREGVPVPLRMRSASNPGGIGHEWVKKRFLTEPKERVFIPARLRDNPALDAEAYTQSLAELDPITRAQLLAGDWDVYQGGRFKREWLTQRWSLTVPGDIFILGDRRVRVADTWRFMTVDSAASVKDTAHFTVISTWAVTKVFDLIWLDCWRGRIEVPDIVPKIEEVYKRHKPQFAGIEGAGPQIGIFQAARRTRMSVRLLEPEGKDKLVRATPAINHAASGRLWLPTSQRFWSPDACPVEDVEAELIRFTGDKKLDANDDIVDTLGYAGMIVTEYSDEDQQGFMPYVLGG